MTKRSISTLSIAYLATMRNWENTAAFQIGRALYYLRLAGVLAFERRARVGSVCLSQRLRTLLRLL